METTNKTTRRRITWEEYESVRLNQAVWINGTMVSVGLSPIPNPFIFSLLTVEADIPEPKAEHPPIPEGWELCTKETYRNGKFCLCEAKDRSRWAGPYEGSPKPWWTSSTFYIQPIESKPEPRRFGSWEELQDYWLSGHSAVLWNGQKARVLSLFIDADCAPAGADIETATRSLGINELGDLAYPEGFNG